MNIRLARPNDSEAVVACMKSLFEETSTNSSAFGAALWEWQYSRAPGSIVLLAEEEGRVCGYYHALLLEMRHHGASRLAAMVQDVGVAASHRRIGLFRSMGGCALEEMKSRGVDFIYTFPNERSLPSFVRNHGYTVVAKVPVYLKVLGLRPLLSQRLGLKSAEMTQSAAGEKTAWHDRQGRRVLRLVAVATAIDSIAQDFARRLPIALVRSCPYLAWRFLENPANGYSLWGFEENGELTAYAMVRTTILFNTSCLVVMDCGCREAKERELLSLLSIVSKEFGATVGLAAGLHPFFRRLWRRGWLRTPEVLNPRSLNLVAKSLSTDVGPEIYSAASWLVTLADWDVL